MRISDWSSDVCSSEAPGMVAAVVGEDGIDGFEVGDEFIDAGIAVPGLRLGPRELGLDQPEQDAVRHVGAARPDRGHDVGPLCGRSEEHTSKLQSLMRISYAVFCLKKKITQT